MVILVATLVQLIPSPAAASQTEPNLPRAGIWRAWLESPGGDLPFGLELRSRDGRWSAWILNGTERIAIPAVRIERDELVMSIAHYDSSVRAKVAYDGRRLTGRWKKRRGKDLWTDMKFRATFGESPRFRPLDPPAGPAASSTVAGRWAVRFSSSDEPAVGILERAGKPDGSRTEVSGTFLTTTGDYRFLAGSLEGTKLRLSCFDGAHAFLFDATLRPDGTLAGDFWSSDNWHETWTARHDPGAKLPDGFAQTRWVGSATLADLAFPDLDGHRRSLDDPAFAGKARLIEIFGSWCPNCHDAAALLTQLHEKYGSRGLSIVGLAFEVTGDFERDAKQVRRYATRHGVRYPLLIAGLSDKAKATKALTVLDRVRSYPTMIFLHADGRVRAIYSGFSGPATGAAHHTLRAEIEAIIEELLAEPPAAEPSP